GRGHRRRRDRARGPPGKPGSRGMTTLSRHPMIPLVLLCLSASARAEEARWFPTQVAPRALVRTVRDDQFPEPAAATSMMVQSIAGLAAKAVNGGTCDEMVWVGAGNADVERWYAGLLERRPAPELRGTFPPWELVDRYRKLGVIKGYILYRFDASRG